MHLFIYIETSLDLGIYKYTFSESCLFWLPQHINRKTMTYTTQLAEYKHFIYYSRLFPCTYLHSYIRRMSHYWPGIRGKTTFFSREDKSIADSSK